MNPLPFMPFYVADYEADTSHLTTVEHGAYMLLLMSYWRRQQPLPNDDAKLARIARLSDAEWMKIRNHVIEFFEVKTGLLFQKRMESEIANVRAKVEQARNAGRASAQRRFNARSTPVGQALNHTESESESESEVVRVSQERGIPQDRGESLPRAGSPLAVIPGGRRDGSA